MNKLRVNKYLITLLISSFGYFSHADTLTVNHDGTADYTIIQDAIAASIDGDVIKVYPGIYFENLDFMEKSLELISLVVQTGIVSYRDSTIIDGNGNGSCVEILHSNYSVINGFTMQNGTGSDYIDPLHIVGGGIFTRESNISVINCVVKDNFSLSGGGGIYISRQGNYYLSNTKIFNNHTRSIGGGIVVGEYSHVTFDSINRCDLYNNYAAFGNDIYKYNEMELYVYLDTCSVLEPDRHFFTSIYEDGYTMDEIIYDINHGIITPIDSNLYVDPVNGDDNNTGLSPNYPLKTISFALAKIFPDSINKNSIQLLNGIYSDTANGDHFPLSMRGYVDLIGQDINNTIIDGRYESMVFMGNNETHNYGFYNLTMYRGGKVYPYQFSGNFYTGFGFVHQGNNDIVFDSVKFLKGHAYYSNLTIIVSENATIRDCQFIENKSSALRISSVYGDTCNIINCIFKDNVPDFEQDYPRGIALDIIGENSETIVTGCLFTGNNQWNIGTFGAPTLNCSFVNCTFTGNTKIYNKVSLGFNDSNIKLYNCIVFDEGHEKYIIFDWDNYTDSLYLQITNTFVEEGLDNIEVVPPYGVLNYDISNIEGDPLFYHGFEFPFNLSDQSPCIDAGTLELPNWIELPEFDLAGNPRIYGDSIDMGAYEWNPTVGIIKPDERQQNEKVLIYPNPTSSEINIELRELAKGTHIRLYNGKGDIVINLPISEYERNYILDVNNLSSGLYVVALMNKNLMVDKKKVVIE